jgi:hypothetical protein
MSERGAKRPLDLKLSLCVKPGRTYLQADVMLARLAPSGTFELLNWTAWSRALGYLASELSGKSLRELLALESGAAGEVVAALLDTDAAAPLDVTVRCKDDGRKCLRLHRRFDPYGEAMFLVAEEVPAVRA